MNICYYTIVKEGGPIMSYETLVKELQSVRTLPAEYINELGEFIAYIKLKAKFADFENNTNAYMDALTKWRNDSKDLFDNPEDANFLEHAFDNVRSKEVYKAKEIW